MSFDLRISIPDDSPAGKVVQRMVSADHVTPEQAVTRILNDAATLQGAKTPAQELIGAFSSPEDVAMIDEGMETAKRLRSIDAQRCFDV
jgi:hypothetical protein